eukprot:5533187-Lingulodinium_polyedra.AAC.1
MGQGPFHPRHIGMLDDELLGLMGEMSVYGESWAILPSNNLHVPMALLGKPSGGLRTVGVFSYHRVWAHLTREDDE